MSSDPECDRVLYDVTEVEQLVREIVDAVVGDLIDTCSDYAASKAKMAIKKVAEKYGIKPD